MRSATETRNSRAGFAFALGAVLLAGSTKPLPAQDSSVSGARVSSRRALCWRGRPWSDCRHFLISEFGAHGRILIPNQTVLHAAPWDSAPQPTKVRVYRGVLGFEGGVMKNVSRRSALGVTAAVSVLEGDLGSRHLAAGKVRYRYWLSETCVAIDLGAGAESRVFQFPGMQQRHTGFTADLAFNAADHAAVFVRYDQLQMVGRTKPALSLGVRTGAQIGFFSALGTALTAGFIYLGMKDALK